MPWKHLAHRRFLRRLSALVYADIETQVFGMMTACTTCRLVPQVVVRECVNMLIGEQRLHQKNGVGIGDLAGFQREPGSPHGPAGRGFRG